MEAERICDECRLSIEEDREDDRFCEYCGDLADKLMTYAEPGATNRWLDFVKEVREGISPRLAEWLSPAWPVMVLDGGGILVALPARQRDWVRRRLRKVLRERGIELADFETSIERLRERWRESARKGESG